MPKNDFPPTCLVLGMKRPRGSFLCIFLSIYISNTVYIRPSAAPARKIQKTAEQQILIVVFTRVVVVVVFVVVFLVVVVLVVMVVLFVVAVEYSLILSISSSILSKIPFISVCNLTVPVHRHRVGCCTDCSSCLWYVFLA